MGSMIYLALGRLEVDWGKNSSFKNHGALFQPCDRKNVPYFYADEVVELKEGLSKPLRNVIQRLDLLGYTESYAKKEFEVLARFNTFDVEKFSFEALASALAVVDVTSSATDYGESDDFGKFFRREIFDRLDLGEFAEDPHHARYHVSEAMENMSAYSVLRLLAKNPANLDIEVSWQFKDVQDGGWAGEDQFFAKLTPNQRFLIVTEGSSDATILQRAFQTFRPIVGDFFDFVDMEEGYPFTGTGNIVRFTQGLISIAVQNRILIVFDNDAEGLHGFKRTNALNLPSNMMTMHLPDVECFRDFQTIGPGGEATADINGRAAAIECYLDLGDKPVVRWKNYVAEIDAYQGEIVGKREHMMRFLSDAGTPGYDTSKIEAVLDKIVRVCGAMSKCETERDLEYFSNSLF